MNGPLMESLRSDVPLTLCKANALLVLEAASELPPDDSTGMVNVQ